MAHQRVWQILVGAARSDAITSMALAIEQELSTDFEVRTFSFHHPDETVRGEVFPLGELPMGRPEDVILYHLSFGVPDLVEMLLDRPEKLVICYHNITPSSFYEVLLPEFAVALAQGRTEVELLASRAVLSVGDSEFNASELRQAGHRNVHVLAAGLEPHRLRETPMDCEFLSELDGHFPHGFILFVSQVLPHKRVDHAVELVHLLRTVHGLDVGLVIAGPIRQPAYFDVVSELRTKLVGAHVLMTDSVSNEQLATLYRACLCYVGTSQHEGLSVPPLEAMSEGAAVVVRGAGAVAETVGRGGIVLPADCGVLELTEAVALVLENEQLATALRMSGRSWLHERTSTSEGRSVTELLRMVIG